MDTYKVSKYMEIHCIGKDSAHNIKYLRVVLGSHDLVNIKFRTRELGLRFAEGESVPIEGWLHIVLPHVNY